MMPIEMISGKFPLKPPRQKNEFWDRAFVDAEFVGPFQRQQVADAFGVLDNTGGYGGSWLAFKGFVGAHTDLGGLALVHLAKGEGVIGVLSRGKICERVITKGQTFLFDDRKTHFWACNTPCQMFVMNVKKPANHTASGLKPS